MSIDAVVARVSELEQMLRFGTPVATASTTNFAAQLDSATSPGAPTAVASASSVPGASTGASELPAGTPYALSHAFSREFGVTPGRYRAAGQGLA